MGDSGSRGMLCLLGHCCEEGAVFSGEARWGEGAGVQEIHSDAIKEIVFLILRLKEFRCI